MRWSPSSVRRPCRGHIWKTKRDRPIVNIESCSEVGIADSVAAFHRELFAFQIQNMF